MNRLAFVALLIMVSGAQAGSPFNEPTEAQKRKIVVPDIKALTHCIARITLADPDGAVQYRAGLLASYVPRQLQKCPAEMNALLDLYETTYGEGEAERFIKGPYLTDLPRAVLSLIRPQLDAKIDEAKQSEQAAYADALARQSEAHRKTEEDKLAALRLQAQQAAEETKIVREKQERVEIASRTMILLRDKFYECADQQLPGLVRSGESADVLANTAMTICSKPLDDAMDAVVAVARAKDDQATQGMQDDVLKVSLRSFVKERVVSDAVQAKAGIGAFSSPGKY